MRSRWVVLRPPAVVPSIAWLSSGRGVPGPRPAAWRCLVTVAAPPWIGPAGVAGVERTPFRRRWIPHRMGVWTCSPREVVIRFTERVERAPEHARGAGRPRPAGRPGRGRRRTRRSVALSVSGCRPCRTAPTRCPGACCRRTTGTSPAAPTSSRSARLSARGDGGAIRTHGPERSGMEAARAMAGRVGGALLLGALVAGPSLGLVGARWTGGMEALGGMAVAAGGTLDLVLQAHALAGGRPLAGVLAALLGTPPGLVWIGRSGLLVLLLLAGVLPGSRTPAGGLPRADGGFGPRWPPRS